MQELSFSSVEMPAPVKKTKCPTHQTWYNTYGAYIVETTWNPETRSYDTKYHPYNRPDLSLMPNE